MFDLIAADGMKAELEAFKADVSEMLSYARDVEVEDKQGAQKVIDSVAKAKDLMDKVEGKKKELTYEAKQYVSEINSIAKELLEPLETVKGVLMLKINLWKLKTEDARKKKEAESKQLEEFGIFQLETFEDVSKVHSCHGTAIERTTHTIELQDKTAVPLEYLMLDEKRVKLAIKSGIKIIPGVTITEQTTTSIRRH
jgi:hypothetical protein